MDQLSELLNRPLLHLGDSTLTLWGALKAVLILVLSFLVSRWVAHRILRRILNRTSADAGVANAIVTLTYYVLLVVGLSILLSEMGVNTAGLSVFAGAVGLGVGIGLQDLAKNFFSGLFLLIARPIKPGDRIVTEDLEANVKRIGTYFTTVQTLDDASVIIPNHDLLNSRLLNWTYETEARRFRIPIGVSYQSDPQKVREVLLKVAHADADVEREPAPEVWLREFGDSSINFELVVWTKTMTYRPLQMASQLNFAIHAALQTAGIEIPFPQRDLHLRSSSVSFGAFGGA